MFTRQPAKSKLSYEYDEYADIMTIEGAKFSGELLRFFASDPPVGTLFRVVFSGDKTIGIERVDACQS